MGKPGWVTCTTVAHLKSLNPLVQIQSQKLLVGLAGALRYRLLVNFIAGDTAMVMILDTAFPSFRD